MNGEYAFEGLDVLLFLVLGIIFIIDAVDAVLILFFDRDRIPFGVRIDIAQQKANFRNEEKQQKAMEQTLADYESHKKRRLLISILFGILGIYYLTAIIMQVIDNLIRNGELLIP